MNSTIRVNTSTKTLLREIAEIRGRKETFEQVILELAERYLKAENEK